MIEQLTSLFEQEGPEFLSLGVQACHQGMTSEKHIHPIKSDEDRHRILPSRTDDVIN